MDNRFSKFVDPDDLDLGDEKDNVVFERKIRKPKGKKIKKFKSFFDN